MAEITSNDLVPYMNGSVESTLSDIQINPSRDLREPNTKAFVVSAGALAVLGVAVLFLSGLAQKFAAKHVESSNGVIADFLKAIATTGSFARRKNGNYKCPVDGKPSYCVDLYNYLCINPYLRDESGYVHSISDFDMYACAFIIEDELSSEKIVLRSVNTSNGICYTFYRPMANKYLKLFRCTESDLYYNYRRVAGD